MKRTLLPPPLILLLTLCSLALDASAQSRYWVGGDGRWSEAAHWSAAPGGPGGAGVPRVSEDVVIEASRPVRITVDRTAWCKDLRVDGGQAAVSILGGRESDLNLAGAWTMVGDVRWELRGPVHLMVRREGVELDLRGHSVAGDIVCDGTGSWSVVSDLACSGDLQLVEGTLIGNAAHIAANNLVADQRSRATMLAGRSVVSLSTMPDHEALRSVVRPDASTLVVNGGVEDWGWSAPAMMDDRDINVCGTGAGQTPFTVNAQLVTNFNGFGVRCRGDCNATVTVTVTGGSGNFNYQWLNGGPGTATWTTACGGPQLVIVTDVTQGISCPVQVNVTEPAPIGVIFFGQGTPPTCADVCDGTRTALAIGGVSPATYNWNNGAGTGSSFSALCAGVNTLVITDANGCMFDTTFTFNIQPVAPNLTFTDVNCSGACDGTATVAPSGGTGNFTITWTPPPANQGALSIADLCAGNYSVNVSDANGCDTTVTFVIDEPPPFTVSTSSTPATCSGTCNGTATVSATGTVGPYTYQWSPSPGTGQGTPSVGGLCEGVYSVLITDVSTGCDSLVPILITAPPAITVQGTVDDADCWNTCDGEVALVVSGGTGPYTYAWTPVPSTGQGTPAITGLCPGDWTVLVTDAAGCDTAVTFTIDAPPEIIPDITVTDASCAGLCDGTATLAVTGGTPGYTFLWSPNPPNGQGTSVVSGLCAGAYAVTIADANGCDTTVTFTINEPPPIAVVPDQTDVTCGSLCDGSATVTVTGGTPPYTYAWTPEPGTGQGTNSAGDLCAGPISVLITDDNGCTFTQGFTILDAVPIQVSLQVIPASCPDVCDGEAGVIVTGGVAPYAYQWSPAPGSGQGTTDVTGLCAQAYSLTVTDAVGCDTTIAFTVPAPPAITASVLSTDVTCSGDCNGTIVLTPSGGTGVYTYLWQPPPPIGQGTPNTGGLCAGDWQVTIASGGCDTTITITIIEPPPIATGLVTSDATCPGNCDGTAVLSASGGTPPLTIVWTPAPSSGQGTTNVTDLCPGNYSVTVSDAAGCDTTIAFSILAPPAIVPNLSTTPETCAGPCTGTATVAPIGGTGLITAFWQPSPGNGQGTFNATGLCAGTTYSVTLTDANACDTVISFAILPSALIEPNSSSTPTSCNGLCDGTATVGPTGGTAPYSYIWSPPPASGQSTPSVSGLCAGTVQVSITDATGCTVVADILITQPDAILANGTVTNPLCSGVCDGTVVLNTLGGVPPYSYVWSPVPPTGQGTGSIGGLCAGTWNVAITDASNCVANASFTVTEPVPITLDVSTTQSQCQVCIGSATAVYSGGTGLLTITWTDASNNVIGNGDTVNGLCAGLYSATVVDENGCSMVTTVPITDSNGETLTTTDGSTTCPNTCDGEVSVAFTCSDPPCVIAWRDGDGNDLGVASNTLSALCPGDYYVSVTNASGCVSFDTASVTAPVVVTLNISSSPVTCTGDCDGTATVGVADGTPPYTFSWDPAPLVGQGTPSISGLCAGTYSLTVTDGNNCVTEAQVLIVEPTPITLFNAIVIDASCAGTCDGNITLLVFGGTEPYTYLWSPEPATGQGASASFGYCAGNVSVTITDANGCSIDRTFTVEEPQPLQLSTSSTQSTCPNCDGTATVTVTGGTVPYTFSWMLNGVEVSTEQSPIGLCGGIYEVTVRDAYACTAEATVQVLDSNGEVLDPEDGTKLCGNICDASVSVDFTCSAPPCSIQWSDDGGNVLANDVTVLENLCEGVYTVQVTNGNGCVSIAQAVVSPSTVLIPNLSTTPVTCHNACDGTATVGPQGGLAPYTFIWEPGVIIGQGTPQATGLCAGVYSVVIVDATGCDTTVNVLIQGPDTLVQQAAITNATCSGLCDGSIVLSPAGGTGPYAYSWTPIPPNGQGSNGAFDLCAGTYIVTVTDANGCVAGDTLRVAEPVPIALTGGSVPSQCGLCDGEAFVQATGGTPGYTYLWTSGSGIFGTTDSLEALCAGLYLVEVIDVAGCRDSLLVPVQDLNGEVLDATGDTTSCPGVCDGNAQVVFNCGEPACTIAWFDAFGADLNVSTDQITDLCGGTYIVTVTNGIGCLSIDTAIVAEPDPIVPNLSTTPVTCFGDCDGTATVGPTGGVPPYDYVWDPAPPIGQGTSQAEGLCVGTAQVTISDAAGCSVVVPVLILGPPLLTADVAVVPITCNGACDGAIVISPQGGTGPYSFAWNPVPGNGQGNNSATDLCPGDWTCVVTDANGCDTTIVTTLVDPALLEAGLTTTDVACFGDCTGTAALVITGGVAPYSVLWSGPDGTPIANDVNDVSNLCAGDHAVRVTDANGCVLLIPFNITQGSPLAPDLVFTGETCFGPCDGTAMVTPAGGTGPYTISWSPDPINGQGTTMVTDLCVGSYSVTVVDQLGCDSTASFNILPYTPIADNSTVTNVRCFGACDGSVVTSATGGVGTLTYTWTPEPVNGQGGTSATGLCPGDQLLTIVDAAGCTAPFTYSITEPLLLELSVDLVTPASCADASDGAIGVTVFGGTPSYTFAWSGPSGFSATTEDVTDRTPGDHGLLITDANGCSIDTIITIDALVTVVADAGDDQQLCAGLTATLDGSGSTGAVTYSWRDAQGVEFATSSQTSVTDLVEGDNLFTLVVTDGPCSSTDQVIVTVLALPVANAGPDQTIFLSEVATIGGTPSGPAGSIFQWQPDTLLNNAAAANPTTNVEETTWFVLTVQAPNGCTDLDSVLVTVVPTIVIPTGFTPNGDGSNDSWQIDFIDLFPDCEVEIYNRWGDLLFQSVGYAQQWDGRYKDGFVPVGTYYYVIELNDPRFPEPYTGPLTVIR